MIPVNKCAMRLKGIELYTLTRGIYISYTNLVAQLYGGEMIESNSSTDSAQQSFKLYAPQTVGQLRNDQSTIIDPIFH